MSRDPLLLPLYFAARRPTAHDAALTVVPQDGARLVSAQAMTNDGHLPASLPGSFTLTVFSTRAEAEAARAIVEDMGMGMEHGILESAGLPGGGGVLLQKIEEGRRTGVLQVRDMRHLTAPDGTMLPGLLPSGHLSAEAGEARLKAEAERCPTELTRAVARIAAEVKYPAAVHDLQVEIEQLPGAYVAFVTLSPETLMETYDFDEAVASAEVLQAAIREGARNFDQSFAVGNAEDAVVEALKKMSPEVWETAFGGSGEGDLDGDDDGFEP